MKNTFRRLMQLSTAVVVAVCSLFAINLGTAFATANNCSWTGAGDGTTFNDSSNWTSCNSTVPQTGDNLVFDNTNLSSNATLNNDITSLSVGSITLSGSGNWSYILTGNAMTVTGGITESPTALSMEIQNDLTLSGSQTIDNAYALTLSGSLSGSGLVTKSGAGQLYISGANSSFSGGVTASAGDIILQSSTGLGTGTTTIANGSTLWFDPSSDMTVATPITVGGSGDGTHDALYYGGVFGSATGNITLSGAVALTSNVKLGSSQSGNVKITGSLSGSYTLSVASGSAVTLTISSSNNTSNTSNGGVTAPKTTTTISSTDKSTASLSVGYNQTYIVDGKRGSTSVASGGTIEGTGTVGDLTINSGGTVAPGHSPGCLSTGNLTLNGTYQAQLGGTTACSGYDQLKVTGTVNVTGATLSTSLYGTFKPKAGNTFTIISNDGSDKVTGTFTNLKEGATFKVSGYVFKITYKGGTGNDVVLSVVSVPSTPDTGVGILTANPLVTLAASMAAGLALLGIARYRRSLN